MWSANRVTTAGLAAVVFLFWGGLSQAIGPQPMMMEGLSFEDSRALLQDMYRQAFTAAAMAQTAKEKAQAQEALGQIIVTGALLDQIEASMTKPVKVEGVSVSGREHRGGVSFGIPAISLLVLSLLAVVGLSLSDSAFTTLKKRFFCPWKQRDVEVEFIPGFSGLAGKRSGDVYSCTAFPDKYHVTCEADCADDELIARIPAVLETPAISYVGS